MKNIRRLLFHVIVVGFFTFVDLCRHRYHVAHARGRTLFTKISEMLKRVSSIWRKQTLAAVHAAKNLTYRTIL